jgi:hypothetical protein
MRTLKSVYLITVMLLGSGCVTTHFSKTGSYEGMSQPENCEYVVYTTAPKGSYEEIGVIEFKAGFPVGQMAGPETISEVRKMSSEIICKNGANGILLWEANGIGAYKKVTIISVK